MTFVMLGTSAAVKKVPALSQHDVLKEVSRIALWFQEAQYGLLGSLVVVAMYTRNPLIGEPETATAMFEKDWPIGLLPSDCALTPTRMPQLLLKSSSVGVSGRALMVPVVQRAVSEFQVVEVQATAFVGGTPVLQTGSVTASPFDPISTHPGPVIAPTAMPLLNVTALALGAKEVLPPLLVPMLPPVWLE